MEKFYASKQSDWQEEKEEHKTVMEGLDILGEIDKELERAFDELSIDRYGLMSPQRYDSVRSQIKQCESDNQDQYDYANKIHGKLEDIENDFKKNFSKALEALSAIDINSYEIENTLDITYLQNYVDQSVQGGSYGAHTGALKTREVRKDKITFADVQSKTDMLGLREQWAQFLSAAGLNKKRKLTPTEIEKLKNKFYKENLTTSFDHKVYNDGWWNATSTTLDFIPVVGGLKGFIEGCVGKTMSGEKLTANEKTQYKLMGVVSLGLDVFTLGTATAAVQGTKAGFKLANAFGKVILTDVAVGWGTKFTSEAMLNIGMFPQLVFAIHIGTNLVVAKHNTTNIKKLKDIEKTLGLKPDQVQDLMKHTGKNLDDFAKAVKNGEIESLLGIPEMNMKYLMKQTGKSADEITDWLKRNNVNLKDINPKNVDDIVNGASGAKGPKFSETFNSWDDMKSVHKGTVTQFVKENKPLGSTHPRDWLKNGGSLTIDTLDDGTQIWKYTKDGITVPYVPKIVNGKVQIVVEFPKEYMYDELLEAYDFDGSFKIPEGFTGNRSKDTAKALAYLKKEFRINEIPDGYILHHDIANGSFQLVQAEVHGVFRHYGGHYFSK